MFSRAKWLRSGLLWLALIAAITLVIVLFFRSQPNTQQVSVSNLLTHISTDIRHGQTDTLDVTDSTLTLTRGRTQPGK